MVKKIEQDSFSWVNKNIQNEIIMKVNYTIRCEYLKKKISKAKTLVFLT